MIIKNLFNIFIIILIFNSCIFNKNIQTPTLKKSNISLNKENFVNYKLFKESFINLTKEIITNINNIIYHISNIAFSIQKEILILIDNSLWRSICKIESDLNPKGYDKEHNTVGISQIGIYAILDVNKKYKTNYKIEQMYDPIISKDVFDKYTSMYITKLNCEDTLENKARIWNGGPTRKHTNSYWKKVKREFDNTLKNELETYFNNKIKILVGKE